MEKLNKRLLTFRPKYFFSLIFLVIGFFVFAQPSGSSFQQGNKAYADGRFTEAVSLYEAARATGPAGWELYYNLGNAYYRTGQLGKSIANYERAFRLNSSQGDVLYNLNFALSKAGDPLLPGGALATFFWKIFFWPSLNSLTVLSSGLFILSCVGASFFFLRRWQTSPEIAVGMIAILVTLVVWLGFRIQLAEKREAVVIVPSAEVRSGPNLSYTANFTLPEGRRVLLIPEEEPVQGWTEIGVPSEGLKGWVPSSSLEIL